MYLSIHPCIYLSFHVLIYPFIKRSIYPSTNPSTSIHQSIHPSASTSASTSSPPLSSALSTTMGERRGAGRRRTPTYTYRGPALQTAVSTRVCIRRKVLCTVPSLHCFTASLLHFRTFTSHLPVPSRCLHFTSVPSLLSSLYLHCTFTSLHFGHAAAPSPSRRARPG